MKNKKLLIIGAVSVVVVIALSVGLGIFLNHQADVTENMIIQTAYGELRYPKKWEPQARFVSNGDTLTCYATLSGHSQIALFDVYFGQDQGYPIGTLDGVSVNVKTHELELDESWTDDQVQTLYAMQEDINHLIQKLQDNKKFELNGG